MKKVLNLVGIVAAVALTLVLILMGYIADAAGAAAALFSDDFRNWLQAHAVGVFWIAVATALILSTCVAVQWRLLSKLKAEQKNATQTLIDAQSELTELRAQPSEHDVELFARFYKDFPPNAETINYLTLWFSGHKWEWAKLSELQEFYYGWTINDRFLDSEIQAHLEELRERCGTFLAEIARSSFKDDVNEEVTTLKFDQFEDDRAYNRRAAELQRLGDQVTAAHKQLVDSGLHKRFYRSAERR